MKALPRYLGLCITLFSSIVCATGADYGIIQQPVHSSAQRMSESFRQHLKQHPELLEISNYDHRSAAQYAGLDLGTSNVVFYLPRELALNTLQQQPLAALDALQAIAFMEAEDGSVSMITNSADYLLKRHDLSLRRLAAWQSINQLAAEGGGNSKVQPREGLITRHSPLPVAAIQQALTKHIEQSTQLQLAASINYADLQHGSSQGLLPETELLLIAAPMLSAPLIQQQASLAVDVFPARLLVLDDPQGGSQLIYNSLSYGLQRHQLALNDAQLASLELQFSQLWKPLLDAAKAVPEQTQGERWRWLYWLLAVLLLIALIAYRKHRAEDP
ncbi:hypothetical protein EDC56_3298 [Sinobacterium caligoides]|uniref:DUF2330 domain-containing protein n=1 Tax=Sinobacterium caligoides TaxID=933926 RepID=A0A3N2DHG5_9GAMM|nr:hypothetical protein [Sinobacterium caligoides]ROR99058.1 hypothetical protein EDC56_3298 [Sinobacterium caligoides]